MYSTIPIKIQKTFFSVLEKNILNFILKQNRQHTDKEVLKRAKPEILHLTSRHTAELYQKGRVAMEQNPNVL